MRRAIVAQASASSRSSAPAPLGGAASTTDVGRPAAIKRAATQRQATCVARALHLFWLGKGALTVEAPEREFRMHFVDAPDDRPVSTQRRIDLLDLWNNHKKLLRQLTRRCGACGTSTSGQRNGAWRYDGTYPQSVHATERSVPAGEGGVIVDVSCVCCANFRWLRGNIVPAHAQQVALVARAWPIGVVGNFCRRSHLHRERGHHPENKSRP
jgi:hypothetical protein